MTWTRFNDMHSGGDLKLPPFAHIYVELPSFEAGEFLRDHFDVEPFGESCECCGRDYAIDEGESLEQLTGHDRNCNWVQAPLHAVTATSTGRYIEAWEPAPAGWTVHPTITRDGGYVPLGFYVLRPDVLVIDRDEIERISRDRNKARPHDPPRVHGRGRG